MYYLTRQAAFEASHSYRIPELSDEENHRLFGPTANPNGHGHNYLVEVTIKGKLAPEHGMVINLSILDLLLKEQVLAYYDHKHINRQHPIFADNPHLQPTSENIAIQIWDTLAPRLNEAQLHRIRLHEDSSLFADYHGEEQMVYLTKTYEFSASHRLHSQHLSDEHNWEIFGKCNNAHGHGHNYVLEVTIKGEVEARTGMIANLDFLDEAVQKHICARFDHKHLNLDTPEFKNLNPTSENFVKVIWEILEPPLRPTTLHRIRLKETPKNHFDYYGESSKVGAL